MLSGDITPCAAENPIDSTFIPLTKLTSCKSREARACRGTKCNGLGSSWHGLRAIGPRQWPINSSAMKPRFGEPAVGIEPTASTAYSSTAGKNIRGDRPRFPPLQRAQIVELACLEPLAKGLHITHWSSEDLARQAVTDGIVETISPRTIRRILDDVDLQPHRTRYWRTTRADSRFKKRAEKVLWCYGNAARLAARGIWVVCADEMPNCQVLERVPIRRADLESAQRSVTVSAASADGAIATPIATLNIVAPTRRRRALVRDSSLVAFMFLIFLISSAALRGRNQRCTKPTSGRNAVNEMAD